VSALSTLNDDDASDASNSTLSSSSEENIHKTNVRAKTLGSDGTNVSSVRYGDYRPPQGGGEPSVRRGGTSPSLLKRGGGGTFPPFGGQYPHPTRRYGTTEKDHVNSKYGTPKIGSPNFGTLKSGTPKNKSFSQRSKRVKDVLKALWKKCVCQGKKHPRWMIFFAVVIMVILYSLLMYYGGLSVGSFRSFQGEGESPVTSTFLQSMVGADSGGLIFCGCAIVVFAILGVLIGCYYCKSLEKYIQSKSQP
ncbi:hypothetical protein, conserved in P.knowlesi (fragment), partial [Plasmodium knowlesi strain H]